MACLLSVERKVKKKVKLLQEASYAIDTNEKNPANGSIDIGILADCVDYEMVCFPSLECKPMPVVCTGEARACIACEEEEECEF